MNMEWRLRKYRTCVDPALDIFKSQYPPDLRGSMFLLFFDLQFYKMLFWGMGFPEELLGADQMLGFSFLTQQFREKAEEFKKRFETATRGEMITDWELMSCHLKLLTQEFMSETRDMCQLLLHDGLKCKFPSQLERSCYEYGQDTLEFMSLVNQNLGFCESIIDDLDPLSGEQNAFIQLKLGLLLKLLFVVNNWPNKSIRTAELIYHVQSWASHISHVTFLHWSNLRTSEYPRGDDLSYLMWKSMYPRFIELSLDVFKGTKSHKGQATLSPQLLSDYVDFLLELVGKNELQDGEITHNELETIREGLMFLLSFVMDSPNQEESSDMRLIHAEIDSIISEVPSIICIPQTDKFRNLLSKIDGVKANIRELYVVTPVSSQFSSPRTNVIGFLDSLLETLQNMLLGGASFIPSVKEQVMEVHEELALLKPFLQYGFEVVQKEDSTLKDIHTQITNVVHYAAYVTKLCPSTSSSVWYGILCLPNVIHHIKLVKFEVDKIKDVVLHISKRVTAEIESGDALPRRATTSKHDGAFVGFREDVQSILDKLQKGGKNLTIISISGMPGQGKTTLARKIYDDPSIQYHFHKFAWGSVTKECKIKKLLADLLRSDTDRKDYSNLEIHDLADRVRKSLKERRYFIVLDDIWDVDVWWQVQYSFPDDSNGSRILFTSRNHSVASQCQPNSVSHRLPLFSDEESWELMKDKLSCSVGFPEELLKVGEQIAVYCRGLPLAVVLIASHLKRTRHELDLWMEVAENLKSHLASEGLQHILELSYKYLPEHLKPCFLYFGSAFRRGENIHAGKLIRLWIAEGLIKGNEMTCSEDLAREYLDYLVSQNLIQVTRRGSMGNIRCLTVHDLLHDLCIQKSLEENFLHLADYRAIQEESHRSSSQKYNGHCHWLCIRDRDPSFADMTSNANQKELVPTSQVHSVFWSHGDILPIQCKVLSPFFNDFGVLTVLDMMDVNLKGSTFPKQKFLLSNIHLRYLGLRGDSFSSVLSSLTKFWNLETLILISDKSAWSIPKSLWEIKSLSYVRIEQCFLVFDEYGHYESTTTASNIESLKGIIVRYDDKTLEVLRSLPKLRHLKCYYEECRPEFLSMFGSLEYLESLTITSTSFEEVIPKGLLFPNHGFRLPDTLKKLSLWGLKLPWRAMSAIGKLPHLESLKLVAYACEGPTWNLGDGEFSKLKCLILFGLNVERIDDSSCEDPPFPCLETLELVSCDALEKVPASFGYIYTLKEICLGASPKALESVEAICKQQREMGNQDLQFVVRDLSPIVLDDENDDQGDKEEVEKNAEEEAEML